MTGIKQATNFIQTCPGALRAFMASLSVGYFLAATTPRIAAPNSTDSLSHGSIIGQPAACPASMIYEVC